jgi:hypothetical protein
VAHPDFLGRLRLCLYRTRDAALNWQQTLADHFVICGFFRGVGHASAFHHDEQTSWMHGHGDDSSSVGPSDSLDWLQRVLGKQYKIKTQRIQSGKDVEGKDKLHEG